MRLRRALLVVSRARPCCRLHCGLGARVDVLESGLLDELPDRLFELIDPRTHLIDAPDDRVRHLLEARLLPSDGDHRASERSSAQTSASGDTKAAAVAHSWGVGVSIAHHLL